MIRKKEVVLFILAILLVGSVAATTYCCEKTLGTNPTYCEDVNSESECSTAVNPASLTGERFKVTAASCKATSYCKPGVCVNGEDGICMPNTARLVCEQEHGTWYDKQKSEIEQCQPGCCFIGNQAAFVTLASCQQMSKRYVKVINWQKSINDELTCLASASPETKGACVFTEKEVKTCKLTTKKECLDMTETNFYAGYLCSASELDTNCANSCSKNALGKWDCETQCDEKEDVRFVDTCGNLANIYDSSKVNIQDYWEKIQEPECEEGEANKNSNSCGDCDYLGGSMCKKKKTGDKVDSGDYLCRDLDCVDYRGVYGTIKNPSRLATADNYPRHGEKWCAIDSEDNDYAPGATWFRLVCSNGEVNLPEECDPYRQEVCLQQEVDREDGSEAFKYAGCKKNLWESCARQNNSDDCEDSNLRDCFWFGEEEGNDEGYYFSEYGLKNDPSEDAPEGVCLPLYPPGFERDEDEEVVGGEACYQASATCYVGVPSSGADCRTNKDKFNCSCLDEYDGEDNYVWRDNMNAFCVQLGDCGSKVNYLEHWGYEYEDVINIETQGEG